MTALNYRSVVVLDSRGGSVAELIPVGAAFDVTTPRGTVVPAVGSRRAFTIIELLVVLLVVAVTLAALLPAARRLHTDSNQMVSAANLQIMSFAFAMYSADFDDRQPTYVPDDLGVYGGNLPLYASSVGCPPQKLLGFDANGSMWGYYLPCTGSGTWANGTAYIPNTWTPNSVFGAFRLPNSKAFAAYVSGRFWAPEFYAPNDTITYELASTLFDTPSEFELHPGGSGIVFSSYAYSPAAMWHPDVMTQPAPFSGWWTNPQSLDHGYQSPTVSQCTYPDLKTRMIEHNWNAGQPAAFNPNFAGHQTPYFFSHGFDAAPITLFFDGHVAELPNTQVVADDLKVQWATGVGLWSRQTPLGSAGYYGNQSWDSIMIGHHVLTIEGIHGRDVLNGSPPKGGIAGAAAPDRRHHRRGLRALLDAPGTELVLDTPHFD